MAQAQPRRASAVDVQREGPPPDEAWDQPLSPGSDSAPQLAGPGARPEVAEPVGPVGPPSAGRGFDPIGAGPPLLRTR
eukprot:3946410-Pyramimonas_sp.AAC.1